VLSIITRHWIDKRYNYADLDGSSCRCHYEYEDHIRYTDVGRDSSVQWHPTGCTVRGSSPGGGRDLPQPSRPALGPTQPPMQWIPDLFLGGKAAGAWRWSHPM